MSEQTCDRCDMPMPEEDERECDSCCQVLCWRCMYDAMLCNDCETILTTSAPTEAQKERRMRRVMMSGFLMMMGCATVGSVGVNTSNHGIWYQDCGVSRQIPGATATFRGTLTSPNSAVATDDQQPPKSSNVKGVIRVIVPHPDTCNGRGVDLVELTEEALIAPAATGPKMHKYKVESIPPSRWSE